MIKSTYVHYIIFGSTLIGMLWAAFNIWIVSRFNFLLFSIDFSI